MNRPEVSQWRADTGEQLDLGACWRTASRFDRARGSAAAWAMTIAHRRAVDRSGPRSSPRRGCPR